MTITRIAGAYEGRSRAVGHTGLVFAVATDQSGAHGNEEIRPQRVCVGTALADGTLVGIVASDLDA